MKRARLMPIIVISIAHAVLSLGVLFWLLDSALAFYLFLAPLVAAERLGLLSMLSHPVLFLLCHSALYGCVLGLLCHACVRLRHPAGYCQECGYDLRGIPGACPECGVERAVRIR